MLELDALVAAPDFWDKPEKAQATMRDQAQLKGTVDVFDAQGKNLEDAGVLVDLADEAKDEATAGEATRTIAVAEEAVSKMELARMLSGPYDRQGALVSINAGAGGKIGRAHV